MPIVQKFQGNPVVMGHPDTYNQIHYFKFGCMYFATGTYDLAASLRNSFVRLFVPPQNQNISCPKCGPSVLLNSMVEFVWHTQSNCSPIPQDGIISMITHCTEPAFFVKDAVVQIFNKSTYPLLGKMDLLDPMMLPYTCGKTVRHRYKDAKKETNTEGQYYNTTKSVVDILSIHAKKEKWLLINTKRKRGPNDGLPILLFCSFLKKPSDWPNDVKQYYNNIIT